jgi:cyclohexyl-isocyanide hydratase
MRLLVDTCIEACTEPLDLLLVPGGPGQLPLMEDERVLRFIRRWAINIDPGRWPHYLASVCTGALVLAATGLLAPDPDLNPILRVRATTHWLLRPLLEALGVQLQDGRVVWCDVTTRVHGDEESGDAGEAYRRSFTLATGGGITAGIDFALDVVRQIYGREVAQGIQLAMEVSTTLCCVAALGS